MNFIKRELPELSRAKFSENKGLVDLKTIDSNFLIKSASDMTESMVCGSLDVKLQKSKSELLKNNLKQ